MYTQANVGKQMHAIYPQLDINFTKGILRGVFPIYHSGFHSGPLLGLHICGFKRPVKEIFSTHRGKDGSLN